MTVHFKNDTVAKHRELADKIKDNLVVDGTTVKEKEAHLAYDASLPEGLTPAIVKSVARHNADFVKAAHVAVGETAASIFKKDKSAEKVTAHLGYNAPSDSLNFTVERTRVYPNPQAGEGDPAKITKNLVVGMTSDIRGQSVKSLRDSMSEEFTNLFC